MSTIVYMSSETHFHTNVKNQNGGLANRVHSMENLEWTASEKHADALNSFITENYGVLGNKFVEILFAQKMLDELPNRYANAKDAMKSYCRDNYSDFTDRLCQTYALTYMTAAILSDMGLAIDIEAVAKIMADHNAMVSNEQNMGENAFKAINSYLTRNNCSSGIRNYFDDHGVVTKVAIEEGLMSEILNKAGFKDIKVTMKELDKAGYLIRQVEKGLKSKLTINSTICWCYQIDLTSMAKSNPVYATQLELAKMIEENGTPFQLESDLSDVDSEWEDTDPEDTTETDNFCEDETVNIEEYVQSSGIDWDEIPIQFHSGLTTGEDDDEFVE